MNIYRNRGGICDDTNIGISSPNHGDDMEDEHILSHLVRRCHFIGGAYVPKLRPLQVRPRWLLPSCFRRHPHRHHVHLE